MKFLTIVCIFLLIFNSVFAINIEINPAYNKTCINNMTLGLYAGWTECDDGTCVDKNYSQSLPCVYGCDSIALDCSPPQINQYSLYFAVIIVVLIAVGILIKLFR